MKYFYSNRLQLYTTYFSTVNISDLLTSFKCLQNLISVNITQTSSRVRKTDKLRIIKQISCQHFSKRPICKNVDVIITWVIIVKKFRNQNFCRYNVLFDGKISFQHFQIKEKLSWEMLKCFAKNIFIL